MQNDKQQYADWCAAVDKGETVLGYNTWVEQRGIENLREAIRKYQDFKSEWDFDDVNIDWADHDEREIDYLKAIRDAAEGLV